MPKTKVVVTDYIENDLDWEVQEFAKMPEVEFSYSPLPIALNLNGVRVKLPYGLYKDRIAAVTFDEGVKLGEVAAIKPSRMKDYILVRILPSSETGFVF